jgi:hypothetical protein
VRFIYLFFLGSHQWKFHYHGTHKLSKIQISHIHIQAVTLKMKSYRTTSKNKKWKKVKIQDIWAKQTSILTPYPSRLRQFCHMTTYRSSSKNTRKMNLQTILSKNTTAWIKVLFSGCKIQRDYLWLVYLWREPPSLAKKHILTPKKRTLAWIGSISLYVPLTMPIIIQYRHLLRNSLRRRWV